MKKHHAPKGFSLIEAAIVLGIVGLVIGGLWIAAARVAERSKLNRTIEQITILVQNARTKLKGKIAEGTSVRFMDGCANAQECIPRAGWGVYLPPDMIGTGEFPVSPFGPFYTIDVEGEGVISVGITILDNVRACAQLGPMIYNAMRNERTRYGAPFVVVNGTSGTDLSTPTDNGAECQNELDNEGVNVVAFDLLL